jgi:hypothetical protein
MLFSGARTRYVTLQRADAERGQREALEDVVHGHDVSDDADGSIRMWRRSSQSYGTGNCLEVAAPHGARIDVRDSKDPDGAVLRFASVEWNAFVAGVRSGALGL